MCMAMEILQGMAEKGSDHVRYLHNLLLSLCTAMELGQPNETSMGNCSQIQTTQTSRIGDFAAILPQLDLTANLGGFQTGDNLMWDENAINDSNFWWEDYSILDIDKI